MLRKLKKIVKSALAVSWVRRAYENITLGVLTIFASNRLLATIYGWLGFLTFNREQYAVLRGRLQYYRNLKKSRLSHVELRRNIHRLEKALIMQPRRETFAKDYIEETLDFYEKALNRLKQESCAIDEGELEWAHDVLVEFFSVIKTNQEPFKATTERFKYLSQEYSLANTNKIPYPRKDIQKSQVGYQDLLRLAKQRRSVRWYQKKPVPRELVDKALIIAREAPTACNRMPYEFRIFDDPELVQKVANLPFGSGGYAHQIPTIVVVVGKLDSYFSPRDRHAIYIDASLAAMSFMYGLESLGLSSSVVNWPDFEPLEIKMQKALNLKTSDRVVMLIAVGYADPNCKIPFSQKKELETFRSYN